MGAIIKTRSKGRMGGTVYIGREWEVKMGDVKLDGGVMIHPKDV